ncbi:alkaline phosphatase PafA [Vaginella massiliensis]|uniref:alkaline phosphatase PafA n=1 Tax=Vaginella massiliensis TaxID=1816680 RepID=UPI0008389C57|nr:alkaline phosphatase PafA [Vaginella massiliensis]
MNLKKFFLGFALSLMTVNAFSQQVERPKLVVGIVVDQMRWDYLYRYQDRYGKGGFNRLLNEGFSYENTLINYIPTFTAIGHATIYTGSVPAIHGIAGNDFIMQLSGEEMYCTQDDSVNGVGSTGKAGKMSPKNLLTSTVTDQLKLATNFRSKVFGVAIKDRGGILPAGHFADAAFWFDGETGNWISSTFYMDKLPNWLVKLNQSKFTDHYLKEWNTLYPIKTYVNSDADDNIYEGTFKGEKKPTFPRNLKALQKDNGYGLIRTTPYGNTITIDLAKQVIEHEKLGKNEKGITDFLAMSFSSTDYIGHQFGINSIEIEDTYLRLDRELEEFFNYLDQQIGKGEYLVFLTADHGASHNPRYFQDKKGNAGYFEIGEVKKNLNAHLAQLFGADELVRSLYNYQIHLNYPIVEANKINEIELKDAIIKFMEKVDGVSFAVDTERIGYASVPQKLRERIVNGYHKKRSGAIQYIVDPQWYSGKQNSTGTTHGTWASYDAHIPFVLMGWGIKHGKSYDEVYMTDIAPTISSLLKIEAPNGNIGDARSDAFAK